ncbi:unnamed protein product [Ectocarpus sp. CCAP 1310/34]|nr:unnamed protein product [Ectocarpus sp. CCAP 1310/34]
MPHATSKFTTTAVETEPEMTTSSASHPFRTSRAEVILGSFRPTRLISRHMTDWMNKALEAFLS